MLRGYEGKGILNKNIILLLLDKIYVYFAFPSLVGKIMPNAILILIEDYRVENFEVLSHLVQL